MKQKIIEPLSKEQAEELLYEGHSIVNKGTLTKHLKEEFESGKYLKQIEFVDQQENKKKIVDLSNTNFLNSTCAYTYLTLDPFNHTYTPAKNIRLYNRDGKQIVDNLYSYSSEGKNVFDDALRSILIKK